MSMLRYAIDGFKEAFLTFRDAFKFFSKKHNKENINGKEKSESAIFKKDKTKNNVADTNNIDDSTFDNNGGMGQSNQKYNKSVLVDYNKFKQDCDRCKRTTGTKGCNTIKEVNFKDNSCVVSVANQDRTMSITELVRLVSIQHLGWVTNPSKLTQWRGWKDSSLW